MKTEFFTDEKINFFSPLGRRAHTKILASWKRKTIDRLQ
jgi:hypothetical protein